MKRILFLFGLMALVLAYGPVNAQKKDKKITITGYVTDKSSTPIANAVIMIDGLKTSILTDKNGYYKIKVRSINYSLGVLVSAKETLQQTIDGRTRIDFQSEGYEGLVASQKSNDVEPDPGDELVNVGYEKVKKKNLTTSVGKIDGRQAKYSSYNSIYEMLKGEIPGVVVTGNSVQIRNPSSVNGSNEPLFVVDGVPVMSLDGIQPQMVKSIHVLKGSDAAIYGVRGSNGVILIDLLSGKDR